jgi:hypothetical protein
MLKAIGWILVMFPGAGVFAQVVACNQNVPNGYGMICVDPWSPVAGSSFALNFSSPHCNRSSHEYQISTGSNTIDVYVTYVGGCFGVPLPPLQFSTTQPGLSAGEYTVNLYKRLLGSWPPPPFDPAAFQLHNSVTFTVRGAPQATPVPAGGWWTWAITVLGLLALTVVRLHGGARCGTGRQQ